MEKKPGICVVTYPRSSASVGPLANLLKILSGLSGYLYLITGNAGEQVFKAVKDIHGFSVNYKLRSFILLRILSHVVLQFKIAAGILQVNRRINLFIFYMGEGLVLPMLICKLIRKPAIIALAGSIARISETDKDSLSKPFVLMEYANYLLADEIAVYSNRLLKDWNLEKYTHKITIVHEHFLDLQAFNITTPLKDRTCRVGFIGRLSEEKGALNFVRTIPEILKMVKGIRFLIGGDGHLKGEIEEYIDENGLHDKVELCGWIPHDHLSEYFNGIKLLVLPSYTEGLPNIMLEAMACGTPVLATAVGAIPDIIEDGNNGFIMENNSPECIAHHVIRVLNHPGCCQIARNARIFIEREFTFEKAVERYRGILSKFA